MSLPIKKFDMKKLLKSNYDASGNPIPIIIPIGKRDTGMSWIYKGPVPNESENQNKPSTKG